MENASNDLAKVLLYYGCIENADCEEQKIVCPFHEDVEPSMIVNLKKGNFFCKERNFQVFNVTDRKKQRNCVFKAT